MIDERAAKEKFEPLKKFVKYLKYKFNFAKEHPDYFYADGLICFTGPQGSGKTISAVNYVYNLLEKYPKCKLVTNLELTDYPIVTFYDYIQLNKEEYNTIKDSIKDTAKTQKIFYEMYLKNNRIFEFKDNDDLGKYNNGECGVIFLIDEIQLYLNSLQSKNVNMDTMTQISQQRKQRKHIVCTSQVFGRLAKPLREQFSCVMVCSNILGFIQCNKLVDRDSIDENQDPNSTTITGKVKAKFWFIHSPVYYRRYDTYRIIKKGQFVSGEKQLSIYNNSENQNIEIDMKGEEKK